LENVHLANEKHNYGFSKRVAAYRFFTKHLKLDSDHSFQKNKVDESFIKILPPEKLHVFTPTNPRPEDALKNEYEILQFLEFPIDKAPYLYYKN
jgi:hypothetical protein